MDVFTPDELLTPDLLKLMDWYLHHKLPEKYRRILHDAGYEDEDIIQEAAKLALRQTIEKKWEPTTLACRFVFYASLQLIRKLNSLQELFERHMNRALAVEEIARMYPSPPPQDVSEPIPGDLFEGLTERERDVLICRFGIDHEIETLRVVGDRMGLTKERIRQIEVLSIDKLREKYQNTNPVA